MLYPEIIYVNKSIVFRFNSIFNKCFIVVDSDVDENTKDMITSSNRFPMYVDCQESLVELSFIKWIAGFRHECRRMSRLIWNPTNKELFYGLINFYHV